jgi:Ca2+-transporting ATPase
VLAQKGGINVPEFRKNNPRIASVPFDSEYKFMATFHHHKDSDGTSCIRAYVKGAPDVIVSLSSYGLMADGSAKKLTDGDKQKILAENDRIAQRGLRVLAFARKDIDPEFFDPKANLLALIQDLTITSLIGAVDPPRPEAKDAIARAKQAGIRVRMVTGDHAVTAAAIGEELGIDGRAITGAELAAMSDEQAVHEIDSIGVIARVAPEHKVRLVEVLKKKGDIVAMTGDGVNDAPALKAADIGIAMGMSGTDVAKNAAKMILTDDNFSTIVSAIEEGRKIYDNLQKFLRIQIANLFMFILAFLVFGLCDRRNSAVYSWPGSLDSYAYGGSYWGCNGFDVSAPGIMTRKPRRSDESIIPLRMYVRLFGIGFFMAASALVMYQIGHRGMVLSILGRLWGLLPYRF